MVLILDGGSTAVLEHIPKDKHAALFASPLWTSQALYDHPDAVSQLHTRYLDAGAELISCMTYQQSSKTMAHLQDSPAACADVWDTGIRTAVEACKQHRHKVARAVLTLGTYAAMLGNGAEYFHSFKTTDDALLTSFHKQRLQQFIDAASWKDVEYVAFETLPDVREAFIILDVLNSLETSFQGKRVWISFSCTGDGAADRVLSGVRKLLLDSRSTRLLWGIGVNCFKDDVASVVVPGLAQLMESTPLHLILYPDNGEVWNPIKRIFIGTPKTPEEWAAPFKGWASLNGGRLVFGGCCQTTPRHVEAILASLA